LIRLRALRRDLPSSDYGMASKVELRVDRRREQQRCRKKIKKEELEGPVRGDVCPLRPPSSTAAISNLPFDLLSPARGFVSLFDRVLFGHVFALLRRAVKTRAFPVVNMRLGVNPHETVAPALCGCVSRWVGLGGLCGRWACGGRTG
jgi:hypothetical protein